MGRVQRQQLALRHARTDNTTATWDTANAGAGTVRLGVWTQLTVTYIRATGRIGLYVDSLYAASATHTTTWNATGSLRFGAHKTGTSSYTS